MRKINTFLAIAVCLTAFLSTSCEKDETAAPVTAELFKTAKLKVYVYADLDLTNPGFEKAPAGTEIIFTIPNYYFHGDIVTKRAMSPTSGNYSVTKTVDANGVIETEIPAGSLGANITLVPVTFEAQQKQDETTSTLKYYTESEESVSIIPDQTAIVEVTYNSNSFANEPIGK